MQVIPSINVPDFKQAKEQIEKAVEFFPPTDGWIHIDVADGIFTPNVTWNSPSEFLGLVPRLLARGINSEVHLMVESPDAIVLPWLAALSKGRASPRLQSGREAASNRIIVHVESVEDFSSLKEIVRNFEAEIGLAISPETPVEELNVYLNKVNFYQVLAVDPGLTGQKFNKSVLEKIKFLRQHSPHAIIEVDGGINPETAKWCKEAGADIIVSASYIWQNTKPEEAFKELEKI